MTRLADFARVSVPPQQHLCILVGIWRLSVTKWWSVPSLPCLIHLSCHYFNVLCLIWRLTTTWSDMLYMLTVFSYGVVVFGLVLIMFRGSVVFNVYLIWINTSNWFWVWAAYIVFLLCIVCSTCLVKGLLIAVVGWHPCHFSVESSKLILVYSTETFKLEIDIITTRMIKVLCPGL